MHKGKIIAAIALAVAVTACTAAGNNRTLPSAFNAANVPVGLMPDDTTSVLKLLTKQTVIGKTIDPNNGDVKPDGLALAPFTQGKLNKGDLVACNFTNAAKTAGAGTTIVTLHPVAGSSPAHFAQSGKLKGCGSVTVDAGDNVWAAASTAKFETMVDSTGAVSKTFSGTKFPRPFANVFGQKCATGGYCTPAVFVGDASSGAIVRISFEGGGYYSVSKIITGFAVNNGSPGDILGPTGLQYDAKKDILYVVDGKTNTVVAFGRAINIFKAKSIVVQPGGKTFTGSFSNEASLVYAGSPLGAPVGSTLLPNHNLIVGNTSANVLAEIAPRCAYSGSGTNEKLTCKGLLLAKRKVDGGAARALAGFVSTGSTDAKTKIYFTDKNASNVQVLSE